MIRFPPSAAAVIVILLSLLIQLGSGCKVNYANWGRSLWKHKLPSAEEHISTIGIRKFNLKFRLILCSFSLVQFNLDNLIEIIHTLHEGFPVYG